MFSLKPLLKTPKGPGERPHHDGLELGIRLDPVERVRAGGRRQTVMWSLLDAEQLPLFTYTLQFETPAVHEFDAGPRNQVFHRSRDEDVARLGEAHHPGSDIDGNAMHIIVGHRNLARVNSNPDIQVQG